MVIQPRHLVVGGVASAVVSLALPWFRVAGLDEVREFSPLGTPYLRGASVLVGVLLIVGGVVLWLKHSVALVGCVAALFFNSTLVTWLLGSKTNTILPQALLPENMTVRLQFGADLAMFASILLMVGTVLELADQTWEGSQQRNTDWRIPAGLFVAALMVAVREATWMKVSAESFQWNLTMDAVPFVGDLLLLLLLAGALVAVVAALIPRVWVAVVSLVTGSLILVLSLLGLVVEDFTGWATRWVASRAEFLRGNLAFEADAGPYASLVAGAALIFLGVASLLLKGKPDPTPIDVSDPWDNGLMPWDADLRRP